MNSWVECANPPFDAVLAVVRSLQYDMTIDVHDGLSNEVRFISIEDPHDAGIGIDIMWMATDLVGSIGRGVTVDLPISLEELRELLDRWMASEAVETWRPRSSRIEVGVGAEALRYSTSSGFLAKGNREKAEVRRYGAYRTSEAPELD